ncbi:MAG TPA: phosphotransferase [Steroidobacteraceae bacterium]|nr:phosphotransferase [Steroidobacteraceae bacterium]
MHQPDTRLALLQQWLCEDLGWRPERIEPASSDASFRRYFRIFRGDQTFIVMDAPPDKEDVGPYLKVSRLLESIGVHVPHVHETNIASGLLLLEDLGSVQYLQRLTAGDDPEALYEDALAALARIQTLGGKAAGELAPYDRGALARELALMPEWFCGRHLQLELTATERTVIAAAFEFLIREALAQPTVFVHRDYHSRNLMVMSERNPGVIDFQDALRGPIGYDLVSLLKDCYIGWPRERVERWVADYRARLRSHGGPAEADERQFLRWFDLIGVQRHLKVLGIFARLWYRDGKPGYLRDLPLTLEYVRDTCRRYCELGDLSRLLELRLAPELVRANARATQTDSRLAVSS